MQPPAYGYEKWPYGRPFDARYGGHLASGPAPMPLIISALAAVVSLLLLAWPALKRADRQNTHAAPSRTQSPASAGISNTCRR
jgi:hypothetical protein